MKLRRTILPICVTLLITSVTYAQTDTTVRDTTEDLSIFEYVSPSDSNSVGFNPDVGASLIRNTITPTFNFNLHLYLDNTNKFQLGASTVFFFERDSTKNFKMYANTFVKLEMFWKKQNKRDLHKFDNSSWSGIGLAYLVASKGDYFNGPTFKVYHIFGVKGGIELAAELIITNNFKSFFPGLTILIM